MLQIPLATSSQTYSVERFWNIVLVYHNRPHVVNRRISAVSQILFSEVTCNSKPMENLEVLFTRSAILYELRKLKSIEKNYITHDFVRSMTECYDKAIICEECHVEDFERAQNGVFVSVRTVFPKLPTIDKFIEVVILNRDKNSASFIGVSENKLNTCPPFPYSIELTSTFMLRVLVNSFEDADTSSGEWLSDGLFPKLISWLKDEVGVDNVIPSLSLISAEDYCTKYSDLKQRYGAKLVKEWPKKATTDPQKFVYEDIAIVTYLICLWQKFCFKDIIRFVDCGCGNGLLVYILNQEGYEGYGLDVRRRPTWDLYPEETDLRVAPVIPSSTFSDCTWIIGNHSDELTPWIPFIAFKSSIKCNFFVLPCCTYDFSGQKYIRKNTSMSQYSEYLDYIKDISNRCGFDTRIDKLRIPSTRRTCLVGIREEWSTTPNNFKKVEDSIMQYIRSRAGSTDIGICNFTVKSNVEKVRNCTQIDRGIREKIIDICVNSLLETKNFKEKHNRELWNKGTTIELCDLPPKIPEEDRKKLKSECGGLKTLLKNHRYIFLVENGKISLREPFLLENTTKYKDKPCWFLKNHPDGCLYDPISCAYKHE